MHMRNWRRILQEVLLKMCKLCRSYPCDKRCPNHIPRGNHYCSICGECIENGEEYIENDIGEYAHWDCIDYGRDLARWLGYEIKFMEDE